jgi:nucleotide-binding universal stress UspA family protein
MLKIERILCPTDFSTESAEALRYAVALTRAYDASLLLLHCTKCKTDGGESESQHLSVETALKFEQALMAHIRMGGLHSLKWEGLAIDNVEHVGLAITHQARKHRADLVVIGSRRRPHRAALLGSAAETVSRTAPCPVLVTHPLEREWVGYSTGEIDLNRVLVAHDFSGGSELAVNYGLSLAQEYQAEMNLLHVVGTPEREEPELAWSSLSTGKDYPLVTHKLREAVPSEASLWCNCVNSVRYGKASDEIIAYAKEHEVDLICIGASGSDWNLGKLFGSSVDRVLREAPCPVLVARPIRRVN